MLWFVLFPLLFIILFFTSQSLLKNLFLLLFSFFKEKEQAAQAISFILLPGVVIHEVAHMLVAELMGVPTGEFNFIPELIEEGGLKAGSLKLAKTDPLRRTLIGLAPVLIGLAVLFFIGQFYLLGFITSVLKNDLGGFTWQSFSLLLLIILLFFWVSNTMFSSKKDLETVLFPLVLLSLLFSIYYLADWQISLSPAIVLFLSNLFKKLSLSLLMATVINLSFLTLVKLLLLIKKTKAF